MGSLYYGDNLDSLKRYLKDESVDLVYLDSPTNSAQNYAVFFGIMHLTNNRLKASADVAEERRFNSLIWENQRPLRIKIRIVCELHNPSVFEAK